MTNQLASLAQRDYFYLDPFWSVNLGMYIIKPNFRFFSRILPFHLIPYMFFFFFFFPEFVVIWKVPEEFRPLVTEGAREERSSGEGRRIFHHFTRRTMEGRRLENSMGKYGKCAR